MPEAVWFKLLRWHGLAFQWGVVFFGFGRWDIADGLRKAAVVEPIDPGQGGEFDGLKGLPGALVNDLRPVEVVDGCGQRIGVRIANTSNGRLNAGFG